MDKNQQRILVKDGVSFVMPFILITSCFALWGFANDITNPMVEAFSKIFRMNTAEGALVQTAFYGGYFAMAYPAAIFIRRFSYKAGVLLGLGLYAVGALAFFPAKMYGAFGGFLLAYFILTCGLSFLETSCNPYILSMGPEETATRRLNLAQSFNPMGSLCGMATAMICIQAQLNPASTAQRATWDMNTFNQVKNSDLSILIAPYLWIGVVILIMFFIILFCKMPKNGDKNTSINFIPTLKRIFSLKRYREGVFAQFCYVGAQIMCWTFIIQYGKFLLLKDPTVMDSALLHGSMNVMHLLDANTYNEIISSPAMTEGHAAVLSQMVNIIAMICFCSSRFVCTFFLRYINAGRLLMLLAILACLLTCGVIGFTDVKGFYCLVGVSACMSLMFPTIYGIALEGLGDDAKFGAAGLIMAILGGSVLTPVQGAIMDMGDANGMLGMLPAVNISFILPMVCFIVVAIYGLRTMNRRKLAPQTV
jgi:FHS family L-fucose permease-like MFS transporter